MARRFDGIGDYIDCGGASGVLDIATAGAVAFCGWINLDSIAPTADTTIFAKGYSGVTGYLIGSTTGFTAPGFIAGSFDGTSVRGFPAIQYAGYGITAGSWHECYIHFVPTGGGVGDWKFYIDGVFAAQSLSEIGPQHSTANFAIGCVLTPSPVQFTACAVADVAVFAGELTTTEIAQLGSGAVRPHTGMTQSLLGYWPLNGTGGTELDLSGNGHNGTLHGTTIVADPPQFSTQVPIRSLIGVGL